MATEKQLQAARRNIKKAGATAKTKKSIAAMPKRTRTALGKQGPAVAQRNRKGARSLMIRQELYPEAKKRDLPGRFEDGSRRARSIFGPFVGQRRPSQSSDGWPMPPCAVPDPIRSPRKVRERWIARSHTPGRRSRTEPDRQSRTAQCRAAD